jgi:phytoene synthase
MSAPEELDAQVRRTDPDRWLATRLVADPVRRAELVALYALNDELATVAEHVSTPMLGDIRLAWWREGLEGLAGGEARAHPVLQALAPAAGEGRLDLERLLAGVEARALDLEAEPFADEAALTAYIDATAGAMMAVAARLLDPAARAGATASAARAWGWARLWRAAPAFAARGRRWVPAAWAEAEEGEIAAHVRHRVLDALEAAQGELKALPVAAFPAVAYATLARPFALGREPGELGKRARLLAATVRGRV